MKSRTRVALLAFALLTLALLGGCQNRAVKKDEHAETESKKAPAQITVENGRTLITLDAPTQQRLGFTVATLAATVTREQAAFPALVLSVQELATFRNTYVATQAQLQRARLQADLAAKEYARLKTLFAENQNVSEKSLQSAEAALQSDEADVHAAEQQLNLQASSIRQEWGDVVTKWATEGSPQFQRLLGTGEGANEERREALIEMTMPAGSASAPPKSISLELPSGGRSQATFVSPFSRIDPRIQGRSYLYLASAQLGLPPGLNLVARLSVGSPLRGVVIPASAVIWSEGKAWVYSQVSDDGFTRTPLATDVPVEDGYFAAEGFSNGDRIVTIGAQALLSEEMLLHSQGASDEN